MTNNEEIEKHRKIIADDPDMVNSYKTFYSKIMVLSFDEFGFDFTGFMAEDIIKSIKKVLIKPITIDGKNYYLTKKQHDGAYLSQFRLEMHRASIILGSTICPYCDEQKESNLDDDPNRMFSDEVEIYAADMLQTEAEFYKDSRRYEREIAAANLAEMGFGNLSDHEKALLLEAIQDQWEIEVESLNDYPETDIDNLKEKIVLLNGINKMSALLDNHDPDLVVDMKLEDFK